MAKTSKMVANRLTVSRTVHSSVKANGEDVAEALTAVLFPDGPPSRLTMAKVLTAVGEVLVRADHGVAAADLAHVVELSDDDGVRRRRDEVAEALRAQLVGIREAIGRLYGEAALTAYALAEIPPENAQQLLGRAAATTKLLRTRPLVETPRYTGLVVQPKVLADELTAGQAALQAALDATKTEEREAQLTLEAKNRAAETWQTAYPGVSSTLYGLYLLAGRKDLAERVSPTARRRAGLPEADDTADAGTTPKPPEPAT